MTINDNQYQRKARYNPNRESYVDENGNYIYLIWDEDAHSYSQEVCVVGEDGISPELRALLDEMDAEEDRQRDVDAYHLDKVFDEKKKAYGADKSGRTPNPIDLLPQCRQRTFQDALHEDPRIAQLLIAMDMLTPGQVDLVYAIYGEMKFGADVAREQGVSRQAINNRLKKIQARLVKLMASIENE